MSTAQQTTTETIKALLDIVKTLKGFIDLQSTRIDRLEKLAIVNNKIHKRYQMTEGQEIPAGRKDQDLIDKKWREVSELGI